jgi:hypothetical protein
VAGERNDMSFDVAHGWERATPVALMGCCNVKEDAPLEWRAPSEETEA